MDLSTKIVIPGASGLVGQNLIVQLKQKGYTNIVAIDKHIQNTEILRKLHPEIKIVIADLAEQGKWQSEFSSADIVIMLQAQIGAPTIKPFIRNNVESTKNILTVIEKYNIKYLIHISSSVVNSIADDFYTQTKKQQEELVLAANVNKCILRPTLMFGWFDRKHLGWLSRFMEKVPVFPIPGHGRYMRQPLYEVDFCNVIISAMELQPKNKSYNITGRDKVDYIDIIKTIKQSKKLKTPILRIPFWLFKAMMTTYGLFSSNPPFTIQQLDALVADDKFELINWWEIFNIESTPFDLAIDETFNHPKYSKIILDF